MTTINIRAKYLNSKQKWNLFQKTIEYTEHSDPNRNIAFHILISPQDHYLANILFSLLSAPAIENK